MTQRVVVQPEGTYAIMTVDPGGTTGVAAAYVTLGDTLAETLRSLHRRRAVEVGGDWLTQARKLNGLMYAFRYRANAELGMPLGRVLFAVEDFRLRPTSPNMAGEQLVSCWVAAGAVALYGSEDHLVYQTASDAMRLATDVRLRRWGLWEVGSAHKRDAWRHLVLRVDRLLQGQGISSS